MRQMHQGWQVTDRRLLPPMGAIHGFVVTGAGAGLALIRAIEPELAAGTLVEPFAHRLKSRSAYWLVQAKGPVSPALWRFRDWLIGHIA